MYYPAISIKGLTKDFSIGMRGTKLRAIDNLDLEIKDNEIFGLIGPNGSGKSTTIKVVLGLLKVSAGECKIYGKPSYEADARKSVGFLPEAPYFYQYLSGRELVRFYAGICGVPRRRIKIQVDDVIELVDMAEAASRRIGTYSKGMLQRIGLAQALVHDPRLVILDEPTAGVDPIGVADISKVICRLKRCGKTVLICSHLLSQIEGLCDRIAILHRGKLICEGRVEDLVICKETESFVVRGLSAEGRTAVEREILRQGGKLCRTENLQRDLNTFFLQEVGGHKAGCVPRQAMEGDVR